MSHPFYPFVDNDDQELPKTESKTDTERQSVGTNTPNNDEGVPLAARYPARIAVYDDLAAAPRVVVIEPTEIRDYLESITQEVTRLSKEQGGTIPFTVIREVVENLIHAYFIEPTISILDGGNTIRFSDQGPGIPEKDRALEYGTTSATEEMKRYIRGVGSGLPYAQQYMEDHGGSLTIDDNIAGGTIVTIMASGSASSGKASNDEARNPSASESAAPMQPTPPTNVYPWQPAAGWPTTSMPQQAAPIAWYQPYQPYPSTGYPPAQYQQQTQPFQPQGQASWNQMSGSQSQWMQQQTQIPETASQQGMRNAPLQENLPVQNTADTSSVPMPEISKRGTLILQYLSKHESVGPTELAATYGQSQPTWSRELKALEEAGLIKKQGGQKRVLTLAGKLCLSSGLA